MKRKLAVASVGLVMLLAGCANNTNVIEGDVKTISTSTGESSPQAGAEEKQEQKTEATVEDGKKEKGYVFCYNDIVIEIDAASASVIEQLGDANSYFEAPSCAFEGIDKMYTYNGFEVDTYPLKDGDHISTVIFKDDTVTTAEGIGIGDSIEKVKETYGGDAADENGMLVYDKDGMQLCFIVEGGRVISVEYRSTVLDA